MNPDDDNDIARLFAQFGGDPGSYQEIATVAAAREARARWPVLSTFDPLAGIAAPAVGADDTSVIAQAERAEAKRAAESAHDHDAGADKPRAQFMPPRPKPFSRDIPDAFLVPIAPVPVESPAARAAHTDAHTAVAPLLKPAAIDEAANEAAAPALRAEPTIAPAPGAEAAVPAASGDAPAPAAGTDPFRRLAARDDTPAGSPRLPDLFNRLLSS
ncbi:cellulose biosynthesis protein BcsP [Bordetella genomosp. 11]|uniref:Cellulose biosynthesis protein BcsR n=1 Tax=Bordetella genomosp. 11 TaxID=1416808 RepID=A0A261UWD7_9BORD|nr:cellulose biosynthesis protein BcsP [Bordetella genomosp. 11]OZI66218.1 hypothetical protein CAL28_00210 [Bordetella genomosp. 11]